MGIKRSKYKRDLCKPRQKCGGSCARRGVYSTWRHSFSRSLCLGTDTRPQPVWPPADAESVCGEFYPMSCVLRGIPTSKLSTITESFAAFRVPKVGARRG